MQFPRFFRSKKATPVETTISPLVPEIPLHIHTHHTVSLPRRRSTTSNPHPTTTTPAALPTQHLAAGTSTQINPDHHPDSKFSRPTPTARVRSLAPTVLRCNNCDTDLCPTDLIISNAFTGKHGRCKFVAPPTHLGLGPEEDLTNVILGRAQERVLEAGRHKVADLRCGGCNTYIGWRYLDAEKDDVKYKIGKYCIEEELTYVQRFLGMVRDDQGARDIFRWRDRNAMVY